MIGRHRRLITGALLTGLVALAAGLATLVPTPQHALACSGPPAGGTGAPNCGPTPAPQPQQPPCKTWKTPPRLVVHYAELSPGQSPMTYSASMILAVSDVVDAFNKIGGTSAQVTSVQSSTLPFTFDKPYHDSTPTIHVGFAHDQAAWAAAVAPDDWKTTLGKTTLLDPADPDYRLPSIDKCWYLERHIVFPDTSITGFANRPWSFGSPPSTTSTTATQPYFDAGVVDTTAKVTTNALYANEANVARVWFRPRFLHELLHAFGMSHRHDYSFMDHAGTSGFPWANRLVADRVRPLPAEIGWLRQTYPAGGTVYDVSLLNTWHVPGSEADADDQVALCKPSTGSAFSDDIQGSGSAKFCGDGGGGLICPGDSLFTRFAIANSSTEPVDLTIRLAFSRDEQWGGSDDVLSPTRFTLTDAEAEDSRLMELKWKVPSIDTSNFNLAWHPLVQISGDHVNTDWIPLRGNLYPPASHCSN
jgi:hypothetical protein